MYRFPWYLTLVSTNHASSNPGQECNMHVRTYAYAYSRNLEKILTFLSLNRDKYFALYWCFCVRISFIFFLIKWSEMDSNVKMWSHRPQLRLWPSQLQLCPGVCVMGSHNFVDLSCINIHSWAKLQRYEETANSFTKDYDRWESSLANLHRSRRT